MKLKTLSIVTLVLFVLSLGVYYNENRRGTDLLSGSDYIKGLDIEQVQKIVLGPKGEEDIVLTRQGGGFVVESYKSYPARAEELNDLVYKIASIEVREKVASGVEGDALAQYELDEASDPYSVELFDGEGEKTVAFKVGGTRNNRGNYLLREGSGDVYLSQENLRLGSSYKDFIDTVLVDVAEADIERVGLDSGSRIELARNAEGKLAVVSPRNRRTDDAKAEEYARGLRLLRFDDAFGPTAPVLEGLNFNRSLRIRMKNRLVYEVALARRGEDHFARVHASIDESGIGQQASAPSGGGAPGSGGAPSEAGAPGSGGDAPDSGDGSADAGASDAGNGSAGEAAQGQDAADGIEALVKAQGEAQRFNRVRRGWFYGISKETYEKVVKGAGFFRTN